MYFTFISSIHIYIACSKTFCVSCKICAEEDKSERSSPFSQVLEEEKVEGRRRDGDFDGTHRPESCVKGFENE